MKIFNEKTLNFLINNSKADKCGYLLKKSSENKKNYQRRYFVLIANLFIYFDRIPTSDTEPLGVILLEKYIVEIFDDSKQEHAFQIKLGTELGKSTKNYIFASESEGDLKDWIKALVRAGSDYFKIKEDELNSQIKAIREILACQPNKNRTMKIFNREYNPFGGPVNEEMQSSLNDLLTMTFEEMHEQARRNILKL